LRGRPAEVILLIDAAIEAAGASAQVVVLTRWVTAVLCNGLGRYEEARTAAGEGTDLALGLEARSRALVAEDGTADGFYREAIGRLGRTQLRPELARAHLLYGEWLRRQGHRSQAAAGASPELTAQEAQVARLARDGLSNPEIGARLFISSHTVQYHLSKVFAKLGITSRGQLHRVLPGGPDASG
jgi:DNA-binding CsgD family transcriptional regulator